MKNPSIEALHDSPEKSLLRERLLTSGVFTRWVQERLALETLAFRRFPRLFFEFNARNEIKKAIEHDLSDNQLTNASYLRNTIASFQKTLSLLHERFQNSEGNVIKLSTLNKDTVTGEDFSTSIEIRRDRHTGEFFSLKASELTPDGGIISQSVIEEMSTTSVPKTSLSFNFTNKRYSQRYANPNIESINCLPITTIVTADLLTKSVIANPNLQVNIESQEI